MLNGSVKKLSKENNYLLLCSENKSKLKKITKPNKQKYLFGCNFIFKGFMGDKY